MIAETDHLFLKEPRNLATPTKPVCFPCGPQRRAALCRKVFAHNGAPPTFSSQVHERQGARAAPAGRQVG